MRSRGAGAVLAAAVLAAGSALGAGATERASGAPGARVWVAGEGVRVRRDEVASPLSRGEGNPVWRPGAPVKLAALRGEVVAFQVVVTAGEEPLTGLEIAVGPLAHEGGAPTRLDVERFVQHYVEVRARSRNEERPPESLGWTPGARPADDEVQGWVPDALIPVDGSGTGGEKAAPPGAAGGRALPWPLAVAPRQNGAAWVDVTVPEDAAAGMYRGVVRVGAASAASGELSRIDLELTVVDAVLPYRPVSFFAFYEPYQMGNRLGDKTASGATASEPAVWQLLHRHHVDALPPLTRPEEIARMRAALDGTLFTEAHGYRGPGAGVGPEVLALGTYGDLGNPTPEALARAEALAAQVPAAIKDVFVYAIDEQCDSPRGPAWRKLLRGSPIAGRVKVGHTCHRDPSRQDVDLVMVPANRFEVATARAARAQGTEVWVYNGTLPQAGTFMIDAPITSLMADGWIAASYPVGRWFLWEVGFWHDGNRGGKGPIDPFAQPENFHNNDGDACLGDGMLLYPGTQVGKFAEGSFGLPGVLPSLRLKALRRGIQDAGYAALARAARASEVDAILAKVIPAALDDADVERPATWSREGAAFAAARDALRAMIPAGAVMDQATARQVLADAAAARVARRSGAEGSQGKGKLRVVWLVGAVAASLVVLAAVLAVVAQVRRARRKA